MRLFLSPNFTKAIYNSLSGWNGGSTLSVVAKMSKSIDYMNKREPLKMKEKKEKCPQNTSRIVKPQMAWTVRVNWKFGSGCPCVISFFMVRSCLWSPFIFEDFFYLAGGIFCLETHLNDTTKPIICAQRGSWTYYLIRKSGNFTWMHGLKMPGKSSTTEQNCWYRRQAVLRGAWNDGFWPLELRRVDARRSLTDFCVTEKLQIWDGLLSTKTWTFSFLKVVQ